VASLTNAQIIEDAEKHELAANEAFKSAAAKNLLTINE
jgi:hypothetical protein